MPISAPRRMIPALLLIVFLAQLITACAPQATALPATGTPAPAAAPSEPAAPPTLNPPTITPTNLPTATQAPSSTPAPKETPIPAIELLPVKDFTMLNLTLLSQAFSVYRPVELAIETDGSAENPFDPALVDLTVRFSGPSGQVLVAPAFWYQDFDPRTLAPLGEPGWRARFTPVEVGEWSAQAVLKTPSALKSEALTFSVEPDPAARGFVRVSAFDPRYFAFDDGSFYFPVGLNMGWSTGDVLADYTQWLDHLSQNGGNYIRVWMASWSFGLEWDYNGLGNYSNRMRQAWLLDQVFRLAEERGVYVMLCLINHGQYSETTNPEWPYNPYNAVWGGPLESPEEFVTNAEAKELFKRRVRYIAARWTASPSLAIWEWWNEVHWTPIKEKDLMPWISEMTAELRKYDPYDHLVSTSFGAGVTNDTWAMAEIDLAQQHEYSTLDPLLTMASTLKQIQRRAGEQVKPILLAEYGSSAEGETAAFNRGAIHLHNGLWAAPFSGYAGPGMYWWWDNYIEPLDLWYHYRGVADFFAGENLQGMAVGTGQVTPPTKEGETTASALTLQTADRALVWVRAGAYTFDGARAAYNAARRKGEVPADWVYEPPAQTGLTVKISGLKDGAYQVVWFDTLEGQVGESLSVTVEEGRVVVEIKELKADLAFKVEAVR